MKSLNAKNVDKNTITNSVAVELKVEIIPESFGIDNGISYCHGRIYLGSNFRETFDIPFDNWSLNEYKKQWKAGLARIKIHPMSCLVASVHKLGTSYTSVILWLLYRQGNKIFIQNQWPFNEFG